MQLIIHNTEGASQEYAVASKQEAREIISTWSDPENLKVTLIDEGEMIWESISLAD